MNLAEYARRFIQEEGLADQLAVEVRDDGNVYVVEREGMNETEILSRDDLKTMVQEWRETVGWEPEEYSR